MRVTIEGVEGMRRTITHVDSISVLNEDSYGKPESIGLSRPTKGKALGVFAANITYLVLEDDVNA